jgi:hypothetical protein
MDENPEPLKDLTDSPQPPTIGLLNETPKHAALEGRLDSMDVREFCVF